MLLENRSRVIVEIDLNLIFDDSTIKSFRLKEGDIIAITYRQNFKKMQKVGMIKNIAYIAPPQKSNLEPSAVLTMDFSGKHSSNIRKIALEDILNVEEVYIPDDAPEIDFEDLGIKIFGGV